jgi:glutamate N-acetyltransferase/amino-acid N-acetyltransferase
VTAAQPTGVGVTAAAGFRAAGAVAGLKQSGLPDVALVVNDGPGTAAAGVFTRNRVQAAPVLWTRQVLTDGELRAVVLNSGGANACTGPQGFADTHATAEHVAELLGVGAAEVAVCSTGLIGTFLPMDKLLGGVGAASTALTTDGGPEAAEAIRTTDSVAKTATRSAGGVTVGGMAKGAGMLAPALATMLCVVTTDAVADAATLDAALRDATRTTFERLDTDGCLSTNDTVLLLASGASGVELPTAELTELVRAVCDDLAGQLLADAEGASKEVHVEVSGAASEPDAVEVGRAIARSALLKCALAGEDPNWGRVLSAIGTTEATFDPLTLDVGVNGIMVCRDSAPGEPREQVDMSGRRIDIFVDLKAGGESVTVRTTDLTEAYVHENSAYST